MPTPAPSSEKEYVNIVALVIVTLVTRLVFLYQNGMGDPDSMVMAAGMAMGVNPDVAIGGAMLYGREVNPGMYAVTRVVYPLLFDSPAHMVGFLNGFNVAVSALFVWPLYAVFRKTLPVAAATGAVLLFAFSPLVWESGTYFHPMVPATFLLFLAILAWDRIDRSPRGILFLAAALVAGAAALIMRVSVAFALPAFLVWALLSDRRARNTLLVSALAVAALLVYFLVVNAMSSATAEDGRGFQEFAANFYSMYLSSLPARALARSSVWAILSVGAASCGLALYGLSRTGSRGSLRPVWVAVAWVLPALVFWLPVPVPIMRHYFLVAIGISWLVGYTVLLAPRVRRPFVLVAAAIVINLLLPEAAYRGYNAARPESMKEPHGSFFYYHQKTNERVARYNHMQDGVMMAVRDVAAGSTQDLAPGVLVEAGWEGYGYLCYAMASSSLPLRKLSETSDRPHVYYHRYDLGGVEVRLVQCVLSDPDRKDIVAGRINESIDEGFQVFLPTESVGPIFDISEFETDVTTY